MLHKKFVLKTATLLFLASCSLGSYAIQVSVESPSPEVSALGFLLDGKEHGDAGQSYIGNNMSPGVYIFGVRVDGLFGTDVGCYTKDGKNSLRLTKDTKAILTYKNNKCVVKTY